MTVFIDAVKLEKEELSSRVLIGWFRDEVSAISAAVEHVLMDSAMLSCLRQLPELVICSEYKRERTRRVIRRFKRATRVKVTPNERRVVLTPGLWGKTWIRSI